MATSLQLVNSMKTLRYLSLWSFFILLSAQNIFAETPSAQDDGKTIAKIADLGASDAGRGGSATPLPDLFTGAFTYRIPIDVPMGRNGIAPDLSLNYRSNNGNGWVGFGWELELGAIERSTRDGVNYNGDNFILRRTGSTVELVKVGTGNEYRAKIENEFLRIQKQSDGTGGSGTYWIVTNKSGIRYFYGQTTATRQDYTDSNNATTYEFKWCLNKVEDPYGNFMTLTYFKDQGQIYPDQINYTENSNGSLVSSNYVKFYLESNPVASEMYGTHFKVKTAYRLKTISIVGSGNKVRAYKAEYAGGDSIPPMSLLTSLQQFGSDFQLSPDGSGTVTGGSFLPKITFDYSTVSAGFKSKIIHDFDATDGGYKLGGDFNGDGAVDFLQISNTGKLYVELSNKAGFDTRSDWGPINIYNDTWYRLLLADFNADGKSDELFIGTGGNLSVSLSNGTGFDSGQSLGLLGNGDYLRYVIADIKGDGKKAALFIGTDGAQKFAFYNEATVCSGQSCTIIGNGLQPDHYRYADFNGDGKTDVLFIGTNGALQVALSNGTNFDSPQSWQSLGDGADSSRYILGDFNGDGLADLLYVGSNHDISVALSSGKSFITSVDPWVNYGDGDPASYRSFDFNGDGKSDLLFIYDSKQQYVGLSTGASFITPTYWGVLGDGLYPNMQLMNKYFDISGDGKIDVYSHNIIANSPVPHEALLSQDGKANLLTGISNGIGGYTQIEYTQFKDYLSQKTIGPLFVVKSVNTCDYLCNNPNLTGNSSVTNFSYANGFFSKKEFRGFNHVKITGPAGSSGEQSITETWFHQGDATIITPENSSVEDLRGLASAEAGFMKGKPYRTRTSDSQGKVYSETETTYSVKSSTPYYFAPPTQVDTYTCDGSVSGNCKGSGNARQTKTNYDFDSYGNIIREERYGDVNNAANVSLNMTITRSFSPNTSSWIVGLPATERVYHGIGTADKISQTDYYYDNYTDCSSAPSNSQTPDKGNVTRIVRWLKDGTSPETRMAYDPYGNPKCSRDPNGNVTSIGFDGTYQAFPITSTSPTLVNGSTLSTTSTYYGVGVAADNGRFGQLKSIIDPNNATSTFEYDLFGRKAKETQPDNFWTRTTYNSFGTLGSQNIYTDNQLGLWSASYFDGLGRTIKERKSGSDNKVIVTEKEYDQRGMLSRVSAPYFEGTGTAVYRSYLYDVVGRVTKTTNPDGTTTLACYNDLITVLIDENGHRKRETRDALGRLVKVDEYEGSYTTCDATQVIPPYATTNYTYDVLSNLTGVTDAYQKNTQISYDTLGRKTDMIDPDMGHWLYSYYPDGSLHTITDAKIKTITYDIDVLNRPTMKHYPAGSGVADVTYTYDETTSTNPKGRLTSMTDGTTTTYNYDLLGRATRTVHRIDNDDYAITKAYDGLGRVKSIIYPDNVSVGYAYDTAGNLTEVSGYAEYDEHNALGQPGKVYYSNGIISSYWYYSLNNRLFAMKTDKLENSLLYRTYAYDAKGNITQVNDLVNPSVPLNLGTTSVGYTLDPNRAHAVQTASTSPGRIYLYDANGNMTSDSQRTFIYTPDNMPKTITMNGVTTTFTYDGNGNRIKKNATIYIDGLYECTNNFCDKHIYDANGRLAIQTYTQTFFHHADHLGSASVVTDTSGTRVKSIAYYPFGETRQEDGVYLDYKFTGQELDSETGLYNYDARLYSPEIGRFITADSIVPDPTNPQSFNRYAYVQNNPVNRIDPSGNIDFEFGGFNICLFGCGDGGSGGSGNSGGNYSSGNGTEMSFYQSYSHNSIGDPSSYGGATSGGSDLASGNNCSSNSFLLATVPGQQYFDFAYNAFSKGNYGYAAFYGAAMVAEQSMFALSLGTSSLGTSSTRTLSNTATRANLYHYTDEATASLIEKTQLGIPGRTTYLTANGSLSPLQAQIELALPQHNTATALFEVSTQSLDVSKSFLQRRVTGNVFKRGGGGIEILHDGPIPLDAVRRIR